MAPPTAPAAPTFPISRINRLKDHRAFRDFSWPTGLHDFGQCNLVYGWNGSGKTTLANLFLHLAKRADITEGTAEFQVTGRAVAGNALSSTAGLPDVRVFNRDFVDASVFTHQTALGAIYYFGEENVEKQKELEGFKASLLQADTAAAKSQTDQQRATQQLEDFCADQAKLIKELLTAPGGSYNNYNKGDFKRRCEALGAKPEDHLLTEGNKAELKKQKDAQVKASITIPAKTYPDLAASTKTVETRLAATVVSQTLDHLVKNPVIAAWVKEGLALHPSHATGITCEFCGNLVPAQRLAELEGHFNDRYQAFLRELDQERVTLAEIAANLPSVNLPAPADLYDHLAPEYVSACRELAEAEGVVTSYLQALNTALACKRDQPFEPLVVAPFLAGTVAAASEIAQTKRNALAVIATKHNSHTSNFQQTVGAARKKLETGIAAEVHAKFTELGAAITNAERLVTEAASQVTTLRERIGVLERSLVEHRKPAEELNAELRSFLGRGDLNFTVQDTGYQIARLTQPAANLSEGEKTAVAFLYFLKSLQDRAFDLTKGVVVVDDPVSSLDANALFYAFGCLKERTNEAGQLFILTHNFSFFRQVRNWFHHLPKSRRPPRFFMLSGTMDAAGRNIVLGALDPLLEKFESEYHFLFGRIHAEAQRTAPAASLGEYYPLPNIARRLLESFLAFRYPGTPGELMKKIDRVTFDSAKKVRILRFVHTYSHGDRIEEPGHDPSILSETPKVLAEILELMEAEDKQHYSEMLGLLAPAP